jgi:hypothetical protein
MSTKREETLLEARDTIRANLEKNLKKTTGSGSHVAVGTSRPLHSDFLASDELGEEAQAVVPSEWPANCRIPGRNCRIPGRKRSILDKRRQERKRQRRERRRQRGK